MLKVQVSILGPGREVLSLVLVEFEVQDFLFFLGVVIGSETEIMRSLVLQYTLVLAQNFS